MYLSIVKMHLLRFSGCSLLKGPWSELEVALARIIFDSNNVKSDFLRLRLPDPLNLRRCILTIPKYIRQLKSILLTP